MRRSQLIFWYRAKPGIPDWMREAMEAEPLLSRALSNFHALARYRGVAYALEEVVQQHIAEGRLIRVLDDWCNFFPGYHLYYPSRRQPSTASTLIVDALRYRESAPL